MGTLKEKIQADLQDAMRARDELRTSTLRLLKAAITNKEVETPGPELADPGVLAVLDKMVRQRRDSVSQFQVAGRQELADREAAEIGVLQQYLPVQLTPEQVAAEVAAILAEVGARGTGDLGAVMKVATPRLRGRADGKAVSEEVRAQLARL